MKTEKRSSATWILLYFCPFWHTMCFIKTQAVSVFIRRRKRESVIQNFSKFHDEASPTWKVEKEPFARLILQNYLNYTWAWTRGVLFNFTPLNIEENLKFVWSERNISVTQIILIIGPQHRLLTLKSHSRFIMRFSFRLPWHNLIAYFILFYFILLCTKLSLKRTLSWPSNFSWTIESHLQWICNYRPHMLWFLQAG